VGIGRVIEKAIRANDFKIDVKSLRQLELKELNFFDNCDNDKSEFLVKIDWKRLLTVNKQNGKVNLDFLQAN